MSLFEVEDSDAAWSKAEGVADSDVLISQYLVGNGRRQAFDKARETDALGMARTIEHNKAGATGDLARVGVDTIFGRKLDERAFADGLVAFAPVEESTREVEIGGLSSSAAFGRECVLFVIGESTGEVLSQCTVALSLVGRHSDFISIVELWDAAQGE